MDPKRLEQQLEGIRHLLSHLHGEVTTLESSWNQAFRVLRKLQENANVDELTGLMRRGAFFSKWRVLLEECRKLEESCGVIVVDVDYFKKINDTHGHATGDEVLMRVGELLKQYESARCFGGRVGGEEFAVAVRGTDAEVAGVAELIRRGAERLHGPVIGPDGNPSAQVEWKCTLSAGTASARKWGYDAPRLLNAADQALYEAKKNGRNRVQAA